MKPLQKKESLTHRSSFTYDIITLFWRHELIKYIFFDIDDTLFDFKRSEKVALSKTLEALGIEPSEDVISLYSNINRSQWEALERGEVTREVILYRRYEILFSELGVDANAKAAQKIYEKQLSQTYYYLPGAEELLQKLYGNYRIFLASNGTAIVQDGRIALSGIAKYADDIFISEKIGYNKPRREFFDICFDRIDGFAKEYAIMIGDSLSSDILGGINAGIKTCLYNPNSLQLRNDIKPDYEVKALDEIPGLLERI